MNRQLLDVKDYLGGLFILVIILMITFIVRRNNKDGIPNKYYYRGLASNLLGALFITFLYAYYYKGGDTFNYKANVDPMFEALLQDPMIALKILFHNDVLENFEIQTYTSKMYWYRSSSEFEVIRSGFLSGLLCFNSFIGIVLIFSYINFLVKWRFLKILRLYYPNVSRAFFYVLFFIPTIQVWTTGLFKDTLAVAAFLYLLGSALLFVYGNKRLSNHIFLVIWLYLAIKVKIYILLVAGPSIALLFVFLTTKRIKNTLLRRISLPFLLTIGLIFSTFLLNKIGEVDRRYSLEGFAKTAKITAYDVGFFSGAGAGSTYDIGIEKLDGSFASTISLAPKAIIVALFRPWIWEVRNPLMLLSALEGLFTFLFFLYVFVIKGNLKIFKYLSNPLLIFCFTFTLIFAFAVGVSTFNFGSLSRYKAPSTITFFLGLVILNYVLKPSKIKKVKTKY